MGAFRGGVSGGSFGELQSRSPWGIIPLIIFWARRKFSDEPKKHNRRAATGKGWQREAAAEEASGHTVSSTPSVIFWARRRFSDGPKKTQRASKRQRPPVGGGRWGRCGTVTDSVGYFLEPSEIFRRAPKKHNGRATGKGLQRKAAAGRAAGTQSARHRRLFF